MLKTINLESDATQYVSPALARFDLLPDAAFVSVDVVAGLFGAGISTIWRRVREGDIPKPRKFGSSSRWSVGALRGVLADGSMPRLIMPDEVAA